MYGIAKFTSVGSLENRDCSNPRCACTQKLRMTPAYVWESFKNLLCDLVQTYLRSIRLLNLDVLIRVSILFYAYHVTFHDCQVGTHGFMDAEKKRQQEWHGDAEHSSIDYARTITVVLYRRR